MLCSSSILKKIVMSQSLFDNSKYSILVTGQKFLVDYNQIHTVILLLQLNVKAFDFNTINTNVKLQTQGILYIIKRSDGWEIKLIKHNKTLIYDNWYMCSLIFRTHIYCGNTTFVIKSPFGTTWLKVAQCGATWRHIFCDSMWLIVTKCGSHIRTTLSHICHIQPQNGILKCSSMWRKFFFLSNTLHHLAPLGAKWRQVAKCGANLWTTIRNNKPHWTTKMWR